MKKSQRERLDKIMDIIANIYDRKCGICGQSYDELKKGKRRAFAVHHREYKDNELTYANFKKDGIYDKLGYYEYLLPIIIAEPHRFRFMHHSHHYQTEKWARYKDDDVLFNVIDLVIETNATKYKKPVKLKIIKIV